ncbi:MAG: HupE/UreJ family protein [Bdellovibrionota bacterium]
MNIATSSLCLLLLPVFANAHPSSISKAAFRLEPGAIELRFVASEIDELPVLTIRDDVDRVIPLTAETSGEEIAIKGVIDLSAQNVRITTNEFFGTLILIDSDEAHGQEFVISPGDTSGPIYISGIRRSRIDVVKEFIELGFEHILPKGLDHILFILSLFLLSTGLRGLLVQVTCFTLAHTLTLSLAALGVFSLPGAFVEPVIALSIAFIALENIFRKELRRSRVIVVFIFGLIHGMGFASVLAELGIPRDHVLSALLSFNVGVELGQLTVLAGAFLLVGWFTKKRWYRKVIVIPVSAAIAATGFVWAFQRVFE